MEVMTRLSACAHVNEHELLPWKCGMRGEEWQGLVCHPASARDESLHLKAVHSGGITDNRQRNRAQSCEGPAVKDGLQPKRFLRL